MNGTIFCVCSTSAISVLQCALKQWRNDLNTIQEESESHQKSKPMMSLIARKPSHVSSSTSVSPEKRSHGNQDPWSTIAEKEERSGRSDIGIDRIKASDYYYHEQFMESFSSASYSKWDNDHVWSSQEWKTDTEIYERSGRPDDTSWRATREIRPGFSHEETLHDGTAPSVVNEVTPRERLGRPDIDSQEGAWPQQFVIGNDEAELEMSVESRSFVNRVNDQVRKRQKRMTNVTGEGETHSMIWWMFMTVTMESAAFMGKNYLYNCQSIVNTTDLTLKHMFDTSTRLVSEQSEISGLETIGWENHSWKYLSLTGDERVINLQRTKFYVFSDPVLCLGKILENPQSNDAWEQRLGWLKSSQNTKTLTQSTASQWNSSGLFPRIQYVASQWWSQKFNVQIRRHEKKSQEEFYFMSMFNDISCWTKENETECLLNSKIVSLYARRFGKGQWSFTGPGSEKKWYCISEDSPQGEWDNMADIVVEWSPGVLVEFVMRRRCVASRAG